VSCGDRSGAGVSGWSVQITVREPEQGERQPRCGNHMLQPGGGLPAWDIDDAGGRGATAVSVRSRRAREPWYCTGPIRYDANTCYKFAQFRCSLLL